MYYLNNPTKKKPEPQKAFFLKKESKTFYIPNSWHHMGIVLTWPKVKPLLEQQGFTTEQGLQGYLKCTFVPDNEYPFTPIPKYEPETTSESLGLHA